MSYSGVKLFSEKVHELFRGLFQKWKSSWIKTVIQIFFTDDKVLVLAGYGSPYVGKSQVLDFSDDSNLHCQDWSPLPEKTVGATGAFFQNHHLALICGAP